MKRDDILNECSDPKQSVTIDLPCEMATRVQKLADENKTSLSNIVIEALDAFLRNQSLNP
jgi:predicted transcriptional regulator